LKHYPKKYIYEPWTASLADQKKWKCVIGEDYPAPIVDHKEASTECKATFKKFFAK
jgi:deoxyribodipyrimidine photolyase